MKTKKDKPRIAFFDFSCCEGCQLTVLQLEETLLELLEHVEVVAWREAMSGGSDDYDIAFCEGSIAGPGDLERVQKIRDRADIVVSLGTCASIGCHNALRNAWSGEEALKLVYGDQWDQFEAVRVQPVASVVAVDYRILRVPRKPSRDQDRLQADSHRPAPSSSQRSGMRGVQAKRPSLRSGEGTRLSGSGYAMRLQCHLYRLRRRLPGVSGSRGQTQSDGHGTDVWQGAATRYYGGRCPPYPA